MNEIQVTARCKVFPGKLDEFKKAAAACVQSVRDKDQHTSQYDWFFSQDQSECVVRERYPNSDAVMQHIGNLGPLLEGLVQTCELSIEVYGKPSQELIDASAGLDLEIYDFFVGI